MNTLKRVGVRKVFRRPAGMATEQMVVSTSRPVAVIRNQRVRQPGTLFGSVIPFFITGAQ